MTRRAHRRRPGFAAMTVAAVVAAAIGAPAATGADRGAAGAEPGAVGADRSAMGADRGALERMRVQRPLHDAADRIEAVVERAGAAGYAGVDIQDDRVTLRWKGTAPRGVLAAAERAAGAVPVRVVGAAHSLVELRSGLATVKDYLRTHPGSPYFGADLAADSSGLVVYAQPAAGKLRTAGPPAGMRVAGGIAVSVVERDRFRTTDAYDDRPPYHGASMIRNIEVEEGYCTAGFAVTMGTRRLMLTAGHCGRENGTFDNGAGTRTFGTGYRKHTSHDLLLVSAEVQGRIWHNDWWSPITRSLPVGSWSYARIGDEVCRTGSFSLTACGFQVYNRGDFVGCHYDVYGNWTCLDDLMLAAGTSPGSIPGDSGGPVYAVTDPWTAVPRADVKGTITGAIGSILVFQDFVTARRDFGIDPVRG